MGCGGSKVSLISDCAGDGKQFLERFAIDKLLGEGEFGVVKLIREKNNAEHAAASSTRYGSTATAYSSEPTYACKMLRKGMQFKDNVLYSPIKPHTLRTECEILRTLNGKHYNVKLIAIYESPSTIYIVTEYCAGGDMMEYISDCYGGDEEGMTTDDVSRMSFELLDAVSYCAKFGIMHRDIKPQNIMFKTKTRGSPLQLIDFGSGSIESLNASERKVTTSKNKQQDDDKSVMSKQSDGSFLMQHNTYAGTAFYISPEMFNKKYTCKTDVWSIGVTLYVLVSGYPADDLQKAFNCLQDSNTPDKRKDMLRTLPNIPSNMPDSYYQMLEMCLTYRHRRRSTAEMILQSEFPQFHKHHGQHAPGIDDAASVKSVDSKASFASLGTILHKTKTFIIKGLSSRHSSMMEYAKYERSISTLLATMLHARDLSRLMNEIDAYIEESDDEETNAEGKTPEDFEMLANKKRLQIVTIETLMSILSKIKFDQVRGMIDEMPMTEQYSRYAYHISLLRQFVNINTAKAKSAAKKKKTNSYHIDYGSDLDNSISRKFRSAMRKINKNFPNNSSSGKNDTDHSYSEFSFTGDEGNGLKRQSSAEGIHLWSNMKKSLSNSSLKKMRRTTSVPEFTQHHV